MTRQQTQKLRNFKVKYLHKALYPSTIREKKICPCCGTVTSDKEIANIQFQRKLKLLLSQYE